MEESLKTAIKPQHVDAIPRAAKGTVAQILEARDFTNQRDHYAQALDLVPIMDRNIQHLSGGEL